MSPVVLFRKRDVQSVIAETYMVRIVLYLPERDWRSAD